ncbi:MAG TPA: hypothetical protein VMT62_09505 [Syntrophorhabdaceae bacterium]|nr:hypothetical protein [Syntrophorhabdaceae bacterium]
MRWDATDVECYSGYRADERPQALVFEEKRYQISEIIDRWYEGGLGASRPRVDYFKVRTTEGGLFLIRHLSLSDSWSIQQYKDPASIIGVS